MKHIPILVSSLAMALLVVGCDKPGETKPMEVRAPAGRTEVDPMRDYTFAQRSEFTSTMQAELASINRDLDQMEEKIAKSNDAIKAEAKPRIDALRLQSANMTRQLDRAKDATESTWADVKEGSRKAYVEMKEGFTQARQWVSDKIAP